MNVGKTQISLLNNHVVDVRDTVPGNQVGTEQVSTLPLSRTTEVVEGWTSWTKKGKVTFFRKRSRSFHKSPMDTIPVLQLLNYGGPHWESVTFSLQSSISGVKEVTSPLSRFRTRCVMVSLRGICTYGQYRHWTSNRVENNLSEEKEEEKG